MNGMHSVPIRHNPVNPVDPVRECRRQSHFRLCLSQEKGVEEVLQ